MKIVLEHFFRLWPARKLLGNKGVYLCGSSLPHSSPIFQRSVLKHALATPLTTLLGTIELCQSDPSLIQKPSTLRRLRLASNRVSAILEDWALSLDGGARTFSIGSTLREVTSLLNQRHSSQYVTLKLGVGQQCELRGSRLLFQEAITCLVSNALESYEADDQYKLVVVAVKQQGNQLRIDIIDFGSGMNLLAQGLAHLRGVSFKPTGSGVGLHLARHVIEQLLSGTFVITSAVGNGTRVRISLPLADHVSKPSDSVNQT